LPLDLSRGIGEAAPNLPMIKIMGKKNIRLKPINKKNIRLKPLNKNY
jgi:hypothetical protein